MPSTFVQCAILFGAILGAAAMILLFDNVEFVIRRKKKHHHHHHHGRPKFGFVLFLAIPKHKGGDSCMAPTPIQPPAGAVTSIPKDFAGIIALAFLEAGDDGVVLPGKGPFTVVVNDPAGAVKLSDDQRSLSLMGVAGSVDVTITDQGFGIVATGTLTVTEPPPPPPTPTQGAVFFVPQPATPPAGGAAAASTQVPGGNAAPAAAVRGTGTPEVKH